MSSPKESSGGGLASVCHCEAVTDAKAARAHRCAMGARNLAMTGLGGFARSMAILFSFDQTDGPGS